MNKEKAIHFTKFALAIFMGMWTIIMLAFSLCFVVSKESFGRTDTIFDNGFSLMGFESYLIGTGDYGWATLALGGMSIIFLTIGLVGIIIGFLNLIRYFSKSKHSTAFVVIEMICMFIYMTIGIIETVMVKNSYGSYDDSLTFGTAAFVPFLIGIFCIVLYFTAPSLMEKCMKQSVVEDDSVATKKARVGKKAAVANCSNVDVVEELRKYKQLLDENILTQEEFDIKKKQLLAL